MQIVTQDLEQIYPTIHVIAAPTAVLAKKTIVMVSQSSTGNRERRS
jgi:hypothetical protein